MFRIKPYRFLSTKQSSSSTSITSKIGILLGVSGLGVLGFVAYDRLAELPHELKGLNFPFRSRWYIRRALCPAIANLTESARFLDLAMQNVLNSGMGSASPESTALVLYLTRLYLEQEPPSLPDLEAAHAALIFKPHVGEAIKEEKARLLKSFEVAHRLCQLYSTGPNANPEKVKYFANKSLDFLDNGPKYLSSAFENHPLRTDFKNYSQ